MIPPAFEYLRPKTIPEALTLLEQHGDDAKILSGGQSLIPMMKIRLARPGCLIDINRLVDLQYIKEQDGFLKIGGLIRESDLAKPGSLRGLHIVKWTTDGVLAEGSVEVIVGGH